MTKIFHPLLALIASATNNELAKYVEYLKEENKTLRARIPGQIHTRPEERERLLKFGKVIGRAIEELMTIVTPATFYRWVREEKNGGPKPKNPAGGQRKPKEIRELVIEFIIFGKRHLDYLVATFAEYYNTRRSHMERDSLPPVREGPDEGETLKLDEIEVRSYVGGLVKSFERKAA